MCSRSNPLMVARAALLENFQISLMVLIEVPNRKYFEGPKATTQVAILLQLSMMEFS